MLNENVFAQARTTVELSGIPVQAALLKEFRNLAQESGLAFDELVPHDVFGGRMSGILAAPQAYYRKSWLQVLQALNFAMEFFPRQGSAQDLIAWAKTLPDVDKLLALRNIRFFCPFLDALQGALNHAESVSGKALVLVELKKAVPDAYLLEAVKQTGLDEHPDYLQYCANLRRLAEAQNPLQALIGGFELPKRPTALSAWKTGKLIDTVLTVMEHFLRMEKDGIRAGDLPALLFFSAKQLNDVLPKVFHLPPKQAAYMTLRQFVRFYADETDEILPAVADKGQGSLSDEDIGRYAAVVNEVGLNFMLAALNMKLTEQSCAYYRRLLENIDFASKNIANISFSGLFLCAAETGRLPQAEADAMMRIWADGMLANGTVLTNNDAPHVMLMKYQASDKAHVYEVLPQLNNCLFNYFVQNGDTGTLDKLMAQTLSGGASLTAQIRFGCLSSDTLAWVRDNCPQTYAELGKYLTLND